ncbi:delta-aminolevulinic acid dehydratase [Lysinibacillus sp. CNPSo 3705]|uniref:delta-aminolevulinic acid dehydratase n=1 Tax=Lysinibacillus sp. CNPSo 3705 TaxID=3028148 RepID=UPI001047A629|nr:delta-aminolevulinic acid dehydratase [Lysinibacillus sp. CNPSo 3705]MDD1502574.1 delta-aminolevulinic acid dehydratase [Lysinibacillus sp. CNPSo 3705]
MSRPNLYVSLVVGSNCDIESLALRSVLESFGVRVTLHLIGRPNDFIDVLSGEDLNDQIDYLILNFHGDEGRFCMPELGPEVYELNEPRGEFFGPQEISNYCKLKDVKVIASGCTLGEKQLANAFLKSGCHSYLGPNDYIDGNANLMFLIRFMYEIIANKRTQQEALELAKSIDEETSMYQLYFA